MIKIIISDKKKISILILTTITIKCGYLPSHKWNKEHAKYRTTLELMNISQKSYLHVKI